MADKNRIDVNFAGAAFVAGVFLLIIYFWGEPDLHDAIIHRLMNMPNVPVEQAE
jgi:hypothetical protein